MDVHTYKSKYPGTTLVEFRRDPPGFLARLARDYGDAVRFQLPGQPVILFNHPDLIRDVLVTRARSFAKGRGLERTKLLLGDGLLTSEGDLHLRQRRLVQPAFHRERVAAHGSTMVRAADARTSVWQDGATVDVQHEMMTLTLAIVGRTLFGAEVEREADTVRGAIETALKTLTIATLPFAERLDWLPLPHMLRFRRARKRLDDIIYRLIQERRAGGERGDLLSLLLTAQDAEGDGGGMTDRQLRDEAMTLLLAGHETTANALTWTWFLVSQHAAVEQRLHEELERTLGGRPPTADDLSNLPYTRRVLSEAMRLYPPAWVVGRRAISDCEVGNHAVPSGALVFVSQWVTHRDHRFFTDPERFDPERWTPEATAARPKFSYYPFGGGPRVCVGEQFAWMEGVLVLASLARRWRLRLVPGHPVVPQAIVTLRPKFGMRMTLHRRG
jgi:cytochrome P450